MTNAKTSKTWTCRKCGFCQPKAEAEKVCQSKSCSEVCSRIGKPKAAGDSRGRNKPTTWC